MSSAASGEHGHYRDDGDPHAANKLFATDSAQTHSAQYAESATNIQAAAATKRAQPANR